MIQRIQTIYLAAAALLSVVCLCMEIGVFSVEGFELAHEYNLWLVNFTGTRNFSTWPLFAVLLLSAAVQVYAIFKYTNRRLQARFCVFAILLILGWYALYVAFALLLMPGTADVKFVPGWPGVCPMASLVLTFLARRAIMADGQLVRAADRIR